MKNKKGFTLIELLAVIIILGVLMIIAIPSVTEYIQTARKKAYVSILDGMVNSVRVKTLSYGYDQSPNYGEAMIVPFSEIKLEKGGDSPFGEFVKDQSYIIVVNEGDGYSYYVNSLDEAGFKIDGVRNIYINEELISSSNEIKEPKTISNIKNGDEVKISGATLKLSERNNSSSKFVLMDITYQTYDNGDAITLVDGSKWYVIEDNKNMITLISNGSVKQDGTLVNNYNDENKVMYNINTNKSKYNPNLAGSVGDIVENKFKPNFLTSLSKNGGFTYGFKTRLLNMNDIVRIMKLEDYYDPSLHEIVDFASASAPKGEFLWGLLNKDETKRWLTEPNAFIDTNCIHSEEQVGADVSGHVLIFRYNCATTSDVSEKGLIRPVITISKGNIKE